MLRDLEMWNAKSSRTRRETHSSPGQRSNLEPMATVTHDTKYCVYHPVMLFAALQLVFTHATETWVWSGKERKKAGYYRAWLWIWNCWEQDPNSGLPGLESSALTTQPRWPAKFAGRPLVVPQPISAVLVAHFDHRRRPVAFRHE